MRRIERSENKKLVLKIARQSFLGIFLVLLANHASEFALWFGAGALATGYYRAIEDQSRLMNERTKALHKEYERLRQETAELRIEAVLAHIDI